MEIYTANPHPKSAEFFANGKNAFAGQHQGAVKKDADATNPSLSISVEGLIRQHLHDAMKTLKEKLTPWYFRLAENTNATLIDRAADQLAQNVGIGNQQEWIERLQQWNINESDTGEPGPSRTLKQLQFLGRTLADSERATLEQLHNYAAQRQLPSHHVDSVAWMFSMDKLYAQNNDDAKPPVLDKTYLQNMLQKLNKNEDAVRLELPG